jgi:bacterioferritin-associated ferredoxin
VSEFYPEPINSHFARPKNAATDGLANGIGSSAAFECGTYVRFQIRTAQTDKRIERVSFRSNGCGFMIAAADVLAENLSGKLVTDLHGLDPAEFISIVESRLTEFPLERQHCLKSSIEALRTAFADLRRRQVEEYTGEKALICTCFHITEDTIEDLIVNRHVSTVEVIGDACNAGTGCGSCQPLIHDMIEALSGGEA